MRVNNELIAAVRRAADEAPRGRVDDRIRRSHKRNNRRVVGHGRRWTDSAIGTTAREHGRLHPQRSADHRAPRHNRSPMASPESSRTYGGPGERAETAAPELLG